MLMVHKDPKIKAGKENVPTNVFRPMDSRSVIMLNLKKYNELNNAFSQYSYLKNIYTTYFPAKYPSNIIPNDSSNAG